MDASSKKTLKRLQTAGIFRLKEASSTGLPKTTLLRLVQEKKIERVGRGLYLHSKCKIKTEEKDFAVACAKFGPKSVVGGLTALFHYGLIEQVPTKIWILVPQQKKTKDKLYRCLRSKLSLKTGVEDHRSYRITGIERTVVEAFRYSSKIGLRTAIQAARNAISRRLTSEKKIYEMAKKLKLQNYILKYWEAVVS